MLQRRLFLLSAPLLGTTTLTHAHHGWSSFDQPRPLDLEGRAVNVVWRNPHAELDLDVAPDLKLPAGLIRAGETLRALPPAWRRCPRRCGLR